MNDKITIIDPWDDTPPRNQLQELVSPGSPQPEAGDLSISIDGGGVTASKLPEQPGPPAEYLARPPTTAPADADAGIPGLKRKQAPKAKRVSLQEDEAGLDTEDVEIDDAADSVRALLAEDRVDEAVAIVEGLARVNSKLMRTTAPIYVEGKLVKDRFTEMLARAPIKDRHMIAELRDENSRLRNDLEQARADLAAARRGSPRH